MPHVSKEEEALREADDAKFATLGRALADATRSSRGYDHLVEQCAIHRRIEQDNADKNTLFAGLARQVGDAARVGRDLQPLLERLAELRRRELGRSS